MVEIFGFQVEVVFILQQEQVLAYGWGYTEEKAARQLERIRAYHQIDGKVTTSPELEEWLSREILRVVLEGRRFSLPSFPYKNREVYQRICEIPKGKTETYSKIAKETGVKFPQLLVALMRNPLQILIPCHRLLTQKGTLMGFYPLGKGVKKRLLEMEGINL